MNLQRLRIGEWIFGVSGVVLLVSLFLPWWGLEGPWGKLGPGGPAEGAYFERSAGSDGFTASMSSTTWNAWQVFSVADILLALLGLLAIVVWVVVARWSAPGLGLAGEALLTLLATVMMVVVLVQVLSTPSTLEVPPPIPHASLEIGAWLGLASTFGILFGLLAAMRDERLSKPGEPTDSTGVRIDAQPPVEKLPGLPPS
jgi:hypothetical protein